jgi:hypothetical protein
VPIVTPVRLKSGSGIALSPVSRDCAGVYPTKVRGRAMSIATTALWLVGYLGNQLFPLMQKKLGSDGTFWCFSGGALLTVILARLLVPETKGRSLEEITEIWAAPAALSGTTRSS